MRTKSAREEAFVDTLVGSQLQALVRQSPFWNRPTRKHDQEHMSLV